MNAPVLGLGLSFLLAAPSIVSAETLGACRCNEPSINSFHCYDGYAQATCMAIRGVMCTWQEGRYCNGTVRSDGGGSPGAPIPLPARPGAVTFWHKSHASLTCTQCHADRKGGAIEGFGKTVNKDRAHAKCQECHKKEAKGPQKCADCHKKA